MTHSRGSSSRWTTWGWKLFCAASVPLAVGGALGCSGPNEDPDTYSIVFALSDTPDDEDLSRLGFRVLYDNGSISGNGAGAACELDAAYSTDSVVLADDDEGELTVTIDATDKVLKASTEILTCSFVTSEQPTGQDFTVSILSASDADDDEIDDLDDIHVVVTSTDIAQQPAQRGEASAGSPE